MSQSLILKSIAFGTSYEHHKIRPQVDCSSVPSCTKQSFKDECDINNLMERYESTGLMEFLNDKEARYLDASSIDYHEAMNIVAHANSTFAEMPAVLRERFENDPGQFVAFCDDNKNDAEAIQLGLKQALKAIQEPLPAQVSTEPIKPS
jgi:phage internal scaffolding protein